MMRRIAIAAIAIGVPLLSADAAMACSCVPPNEKTRLKEMDGAFVGRLVAVRDGNPATFIYRVRRVYKSGPGLRRGHRVRVRSPRFEAACGLPEKKGRLYALFLQRRTHRWHSNLCLTTTPRRMRRAAEASSAGPAGSPGSAGCV